MAERNKFRFMARQTRCALNAFTIFASISLIGCQSNLNGRLIDQMDETISSQDARVNIIQISGDSEVGKIVLGVNESGIFEVEKDLPKGTYLVEALVPGYNIVSTKVVLSDSEKVIIKMQKLKDIKSKSVIHSHLTIPSGRGEGKASLTPPKL